MNDNGGINGKKIKLNPVRLRLPRSRGPHQIQTLQAAGLRGGAGVGNRRYGGPLPTVTKDKIPYVSASYSAHLTDPKKTPYNLFAATDYSTNARAALTAWFDERWPKHKDYGKRKPRFQCAYMFASPYSSAPIKAVKDQATLLGFEIGPDQDVSLFAIDTKSQVLAMKDFKPDVVWHGNTVMSVAATLRDAYALGLEAGHIIDNWGFDENLPKLAGKAAEGVMGVSVCAFFGEDVPMMDKVIEYAKKYNPGIPLEKRTVHTIQAWSNALALWEAMKRADKAGELDGVGILKEGFETMRGYELFLGGAPDIHRRRSPRIRAGSDLHDRQRKNRSGQGRRHQEPLAGSLGQRMARLVILYWLKKLTGRLVKSLIQETSFLPVNLLTSKLFAPHP